MQIRRAAGNARNYPELAYDFTCEHVSENHEIMRSSNQVNWDPPHDDALTCIAGIVIPLMKTNSSWNATVGASAQCLPRQFHWHGEHLGNKLPSKPKERTAAEPNDAQHYHKVAQDSQLGLHKPLGTGLTLQSTLHSIAAGSRLGRLL